MPADAAARGWPDRRLLDLLGVELPIIQAPMAGATSVEMVTAVAAAGGLGSLPCAMLDADGVRADVGRIRAATARPINLNFFCHAPPDGDPERLERWRRRLAPYYQALGLEEAESTGARGRAPFDAALCEVVEDLRPAVVSFHFGLPEAGLLRRVKAAGCRVLASATTVAEARWLVDRAVDAVIAQGAEAGGHRGLFLSTEVATQVGSFALIPQVVDAVTVPVIAAGGIADGRGIAAAFALGAAGVQIGTAYLFCAEASLSPVHAAALRDAADDATVLTNVFTGRPARGLVNRLVRDIGPLSPDAPPFPLAAAPLVPLREATEAKGGRDFSALRCGQAAPLGRDLGAGALTRQLAGDALQRLRGLAQPHT